MTVLYQFENGVAVVSFDNPPLNVCGQAQRAGLAAAIDRAVSDGATRLIITGKGSNFVAGADAKEFNQRALPPHLNDVLLVLANLAIPTVAAIHGAALGGGLEIALACRYRIASPSAVLGLPEVTLGVVPGAGGTQRLPRLIGLKDALDMIANGKRIGAEDALRLGLVDAIAADPLAAAHALDAQTLRRAIVADARPAPAPDAAAVAAAHASADKRSAGQTAPHLAIDLVGTAATLPLETALLRERETFISLRGADQARALRHIFFAERAALSQGKAYPKPARAIQTAIVVGGGNMGAAIAYAFAAAGLSVTVIETDSAGQTRAETNLAKLIEAGRARGLLSPDAATALQARLTTRTGYAGLPAADLAIEAAFESMDVKRQIFAALQDALPDDCILATNTSYLDVNQLAETIRNPQRFLGLHFFAPAHIMKLLEIVNGAATSRETLGAAFGLAKTLGKMPVLAGVCDGFIGNRILTRYRLVADILLLEGALPDQVDAAMRGFGMAMGPYEAQDMSGLDIAYANRQRNNLRSRSDIRSVPIADQLVEDLKRLGRKTGAGWYDYDAAGRPLPSPQVSAVVEQASAQANTARLHRSAHDIALTLVTAMIAEACDILSEGIAASPRDIDLVMVHGYGFPRWRGGLMHHADSIGLPSLLRDIEGHAARDALSWHVPALLQDLCAKGQSFDSLNNPGDAA